MPVISSISAFNIPQYVLITFVLDFNYNQNPQRIASSCVKITVTREFEFKKEEETWYAITKSIAPFLHGHGIAFVLLFWLVRA